MRHGAKFDRRLFNLVQNGYSLFVISARSSLEKSGLRAKANEISYRAILESVYLPLAKLILVPGRIWVSECVWDEGNKIEGLKGSRNALEASRIHANSRESYRFVVERSGESKSTQGIK